MKLDKGEIRKKAIEFLSKIGFDAWINNNRVEPGRIFIGRRGVPDIAGIRKVSGVAMYCEVKSFGDVFSYDQVMFLDNLVTYGAHAYVAIGNESGGWDLKSYDPRSPEIVKIRSKGPVKKS